MTKTIPGNRIDRRTFLGGAMALGFGATSDASAQTTSQQIGHPPVLNDPQPLRPINQYTVYIPAKSKTGPFMIYTCEFDSSWVIFESYGVPSTLEEQLAAITIDDRIEPYFEEVSDGFRIYGGDIKTKYSGDYSSNFLCRTTNGGMKPVFTHFGLHSEAVTSREDIQASLDAGRLVWIKTTVDFKDWRNARWITPEEEELPVVFSNDHAMVINGYRDDLVVLRDVLGPTSTNWDRRYEIEVPWDRFLKCWGAQNNDGLSVWRPDEATPVPIVPVG